MAGHSRIRINASVHSIRFFRPPHASSLTMLLPPHGRIHAGLRLRIRRLMKTGSTLLPVFPSCRQTICVRLATHPPPGHGFAGRHAFRNVQGPDARWRGVIVSPEKTTVLRTGVAEDFRMMRDQDGLMLILKELPQGQRPGLQLRQADLIVRFVDQNRALARAVGPT